MPAEKKKRASLGRIFLTYLRIARRYPWSGILVFLCYGIGVIMGDILLKYYYKLIFDRIAGVDPHQIAWMDLKPLFLMVVFFIITFNLFFRIADFCIVYLQSNMMRELQNYALEKLQRHSYNFFVGSFTGGLVAKVKRFTRAFETIHDKLVFNFWFTGLNLIGVFIVLLITIPFLAWFFALWCVAYLVVTTLFVRYRMRYDLLEAEADSAVTGQLADIITNILNLKVFTSGKRELQHFAGYTQNEYKARTRAWYLGNSFYALQATAMGILEIVGIYTTLHLWLDGKITAGTVILVQTYFTTVSMKIWEIGRALGDTFKALSDAEEMVSILELPLEVQDPAVPKKSRMKKGHIAFKKSSFGYSTQKNVFDAFTLDIPAGQRVGIVGHSGAGKSTLFKLLLRFLDVTGGSITVDGQDIRTVTQDDLRTCMSYVPQDPILFHRSLLENIAYARAGATPEEVMEAARRAHAHDFIESLPAGYDTLVGERGVKLSGGERQRIAIARATLKNAPILLLDEATSSLDSLSEKYVQEQLAELMRGRTTLAIAHRISTIRQMDRILVMDKGAITEDGTHDELLTKNGTYASLWMHQSQGFLTEE
ncbi:MAG: hypothetical protein JWM56_648 [Candidatus Peribacteria bacterium]|nr:hypothetical protein [Candidatus Peribacteria bacterium]